MNTTKLREHIQNVHEDQTFTLSTQEMIVDARARKANKNVKLKCGHCGFESWSTTIMTKHKNDHIDSDAEKCDQCEYEAESREMLRDHILNAHGEMNANGEEEKCEQCEYKFNNRTMLREHVQNIHTDNFHTDGTDNVQMRERKTCEECGYKTTSNTVLKKHRELMHREKKGRKESKRLYCGLCEKYCYRKDKLEEHIDSVHGVTIILILISTGE